MLMFVRRFLYNPLAPQVKPEHCKGLAASALHLGWKKICTNIHMPNKPLKMKMTLFAVAARHAVPFAPATDKDPA